MAAVVVAEAEEDIWKRKNKIFSYTFYGKNVVFLRKRGFDAYGEISLKIFHISEMCRQYFNSTRTFISFKISGKTKFRKPIFIFIV